MQADRNRPERTLDEILKSMAETKAEIAAMQEKIQNLEEEIKRKRTNEEKKRLLKAPEKP